MVSSLFLSLCKALYLGDESELVGIQVKSVQNACFFLQDHQPLRLVLQGDISHAITFS